MQKILIKIYTDNRVDILAFPDDSGSGIYEKLNKLIGESCTGFEQVYPRRLYKELGQSAVYGRRVHMLVDEDGYRKELPINLIASWLYGTDIHQNPILGDVLIVREVLREGSIDIIGLEERQGMELFQKFMLFS